LGAERKIDPVTLTRYTGTYSASDANVPPIVIELKEGHLTLAPKCKETSTLIARSDHEFYMKEWESEAEFLKAPDGTLTLSLFTLPLQSVLTMKKTSGTAR
jgi:hypothetical protein